MSTVNSTGGGGDEEEELQYLRELLSPPPTSLTLCASLQLLQPPADHENVFLMTRDYLQNWLVWAYHEPVLESETARVQEVVRLLSHIHGLKQPYEGMKYTNPGPIDASPLSVKGHPLLLRPSVVVFQQKVHSTMTLKRSRSFPTLGETTATEKVEKNGEVQCCAVTETFYETLRSVHGVVCDDGESISFQPHGGDGSKGVLLHHHVRHKQPTPENGSSRNHTVRPVEFRRKVEYKPSLVDDSAEPPSPMSKLLREESERNRTRYVPEVEMHPIKFSYAVVDSSSSRAEPGGKYPKLGFVLVPQCAGLEDAMHELIKTVAPNKASSCVRVWSKRMYHSSGRRNMRATSVGDDFDLVDMDESTQPMTPRRKKKANLNKRSVGDWARGHSGFNKTNKEIEILIETRTTPSTKWLRHELELENRIQVGDFVDAQDVAGKWYEALVRAVDEDTVTVHYLGWAKRWDVKLKRRRNGKEIEGIPAKVKPPSPLWSHTRRWRDSVSKGQVVEVRDSSSLADRPKWYQAEIKKVGGDEDPPRELVRGAELETLVEQFEHSCCLEESRNGNKRKPQHLLLLHRNRQVLVEVDQEKINNPTAASSVPMNQLKDDLTPMPPFLRWVNLYGEEICEAGTHLKLDQGRDRPSILRYEFDSSRPPVEVLKPLNALLGSGFVRESLRGTPPAPGSVGLHNLGNSCFLNSIIQCLAHMEPVTNFFINDRYISDLNRTNPLGSGGTVANAFAALLKDMWGGQYSTLVPRKLKTTVANFAQQFNNSYQHDSQEFCSFLMDGLHEDLNRAKSKPYVEEFEGFGVADEVAAIESWRKHLLRHDSIIVDHCQGMHRSHLTCPVCGRESIKFDVFSSISLPIVPTKEGSTIPLDDCLEKFMEGEQLDELNAWYCPNCKKHVCALKLIALWSVPDILILHLKRFTFDTCHKSGGVLRSKIDDNVEFPIEGLDLRRFILGPVNEDAPPVYQLFGVSEHSGPTANSGHYTATVRNSKDGRWYRYNDSHVGRTSGEASITGGAYLLFYRRTKGSCKWGGMEAMMKERNIDPYGGLDVDPDGFKQVNSKKKKKKPS